MSAVASARRLIALETLREVFRFRDYSREGWSYRPSGVADFGENDQLRAAAAPGEEEAMYFHANFDASGARLDGAHSYRWRLPAGGVPVDAFWSLTMNTVTSEGPLLFRREPDQPLFNRRSHAWAGCRRGDGSLEILIQRERPEDAMAANWLPAPEGPLRLALRAYLPRQQLRDRTWRVPPLITLA